MQRKLLYLLLITLNIILAFTAIPGGFCLLTGIAAPPKNELSNTLFSDYTIPGLSLIIIVGGSALFAVIMLIRKQKYALFYSAMAGVIIMIFEFVEVITIGTPTGAGLTMQIIYFGIGVILVKWSLYVLYLDIKNKTFF